MVKKIKQITREGYENLVKELDELRKVKLPNILERLSEAKEMGDLSENFEYKSAMEDKDFIHSKIAEIENLLNDIQIIETDKKKGEKIVEFGATVTVDVEDDKQYTVTIVGTGEVTMDEQKKISFESPLGMAIKGKKVGEIGKMRLAGNRQNVTILAIK